MVRLSRLGPRLAALALTAAVFVGCAELLQVQIPPVLLPPTQSPPQSPAPGTPPSSPSGSFPDCQIDAACEEGRAWASEARSVVNIRLADNLELGGCTGVLLNNARGDRTPYVLLSRHCRSGSRANLGENLSWWAFYFRGPADRCNAAVTDRVGACTDANRCIRGATVVASGSANGGFSRNRDFMLVRLSRPIPASWGVTYAGWSARSAPPQRSVILGHPRGLPVALAGSNRPAERSTACDPEAGMLTIRLDRGQLVTGQSGAPVFDEQRAVRGVAITGTGCTFPSRTCATSLHYNWTYGPAGSRLIDHLAGGDARVQSVGAR